MLFYGVGNQDWVSVSDDYSLDIGTGSFTIEMWIKSSSYSNPVIPISKGTPNAGCISTGAMGYEIRQFDTYYNFMICHYDTGPTSAQTNSPSFTTTDGQWHHLVAVFNRGGNEMKIYLDGAAGTASSANFGTKDINSASNFCASSRCAAYILNGFIDEIRAYSKALSTSEVCARCKMFKSASFCNNCSE